MPASTKKRTVAEIAGDLLLERRKSVGDAAAERRGRPTGAEDLKRREEREAFWKRFISPEQEQAMLEAGMASGLPEHQVRMQVSAAVYKRRWELWEKKGELADRLKWAREMADLGPPEGSEQPTSQPAESTAPEPAEDPTYEEPYA